MNFIIYSDFSIENCVTNKLFLKSSFSIEESFPKTFLRYSKLQCLEFAVIHQSLPVELIDMICRGIIEKELFRIQKQIRTFNADFKLSLRLKNLKECRNVLENQQCSIIRNPIEQNFLDVKPYFRIYFEKSKDILMVPDWVLNTSPSLAFVQSMIQIMDYCGSEIIRCPFSSRAFLDYLCLNNHEGAKNNIFIQLKYDYHYYSEMLHLALWLYDLPFQNFIENFTLLVKRDL